MGERYVFRERMARLLLMDIRTSVGYETRTSVVYETPPKKIMAPSNMPPRITFRER
jgi:hypothetical protein